MIFNTKYVATSTQLWIEIKIRKQVARHIEKANYVCMQQSHNNQQWLLCKCVSSKAFVKCMHKQNLLQPIHKTDPNSMRGEPDVELDLMCTLTARVTDTCSYYCIIKGVVRRYCFDTWPFHVNSLFIMKCDVKCYDYALKMMSHGQWCILMHKIQ